MSTAPTNQDLEAFIWVASCIPVTLNMILFAVGIALRQLLFLAGCLFGLLITLLTAGCLVGAWLNME
ncbi:MAG: hypothetical protein JXB07_09410 [Anaerolineae bacterium]|nr:hypothetical protein [Anaerolineae bacterium]